MIYVVNEETGEVLFKEDAWCVGAWESAYNFIAESDMQFIKNEVTVMGDMILWAI